jgi:hypothetical protein
MQAKGERIEQFSGSQGSQLQIVALMRNKQEKIMSITKCFVQNSVVVSVLLVTALSPIATEASSESDRTGEARTRSRTIAKAERRT